MSYSLRDKKNESRLILVTYSSGHQPYSNPVLNGGPKQSSYEEAKVLLTSKHLSSGSKQPSGKWTSSKLPRAKHSSRVVLMLKEKDRLGHLRLNVF